MKILSEKKLFFPQLDDLTKKIERFIGSLDLKFSVIDPDRSLTAWDPIETLSDPFAFQDPLSPSFPDQKVNEDKKEGSIPSPFTFSRSDSIQSSPKEIPTVSESDSFIGKNKMANLFQLVSKRKNLSLSKDEENEIKNEIEHKIEFSDRSRLLSKMERIDPASDHLFASLPLLSEKMKRFPEEIDPSDEKTRSLNNPWSLSDKNNKQLLSREITTLFDKKSMGDEEILKKLDGISKDLASVDHSLVDLASKMEEEKNSTISISFEE